MLAMPFLLKLLCELEYSRVVIGAPVPKPLKSTESPLLPRDTQHKLVCYVWYLVSLCIGVGLGIKVVLLRVAQ